MRFRYLLPVLLLTACPCGDQAMLAGPIRTGIQLPDTIRALADIHRVRLVIESVHEELVAAGLVADRLREMWRTQLEDAGITVVEEGDVPFVFFSADAILEPALPDAISVTAQLRVEQTVHVPRLGEHMRLPTYTRFYSGLSTRKSLRNEQVRFIKGMMRSLVQRMGLATRQSRKVTGNG